MGTNRNVRAAVVAALAAVLSGVCVLLIASGVAWLSPAWRSRDGNPIPANFQYLAFPKPDAPLLDASRQARVGTLTHAAIVTQEELTSDFVGVHSRDGPRYVARGDLEFVPTNTNTHESVAALVSTRGGDIRYTIEQQTIGPARISFRFSEDDDSYTNYVYTATATNVTPLEMTEVNGTRIAFTLASAVPIAVLIAAAVWSFVWRRTKC